MHESPLQVDFASAPSAALANLVKKPDPLDERADCLLLDLRSAHAEHAKSALRTIAAVLAPQLYLQGEKSWIVATGPVAPIQAAKQIAEQFIALGHKNVRIAIIHGELLTEQLEDLAQAGANLTDEQGVSLLDYKVPPRSILTDTSAAPIAEALSAGAQVVLTQMARPGTMALGRYGSQMAGASLPLKAAAAVAASADLLLQLDSIQTDSSSELLIAKTNSLGECLIENLNGNFSSNYDREQKLSGNLPDVGYESSWTANSQHCLLLEEIKGRVASESCKLLVELAGNYRLNFQTMGDDASNIAMWLHSIASLIPSEIGLKLTTLAIEDGKKYDISLESSKRTSLEAIASQIELICLPAHGGLQLDSSLSSCLSELTRSFEMEIFSGNSMKHVEFQQQTLTVEEWID